MSESPFIPFSTPDVFAAPAGLQALGDADAAVCVDGACFVPPAAVDAVTDAAVDAVPDADAESGAQGDQETPTA